MTPLRPARPGARPALARQLATTGLGALIVAALSPAGHAYARGFAGTGTIVQGNAQITTGATRTDIDVRSPQVVIDWTADGATPASLFPDYTIDFLPSGSSANFSGSDGAAAGYTVLNRVLLSGRAAFNGAVQSSLGSATGGNVWFYSPNGIYVGPGATFSVGSLVLTANAIDTTGGLYGPGGEIRFRGPPGGPAGPFDPLPPAVTIDKGARLDALADNAYLALVAPRIVQNGALNANGSIALVAAEQADLTINAGLVDVVVTQGTTALNGIIHGGTTGGPVTGGAQTIRMVAIPKNDAMTMLLAGTIGYQAASQVSTEGTTVVLEAGDPTAPARASIQMGEFGDLAFTSPMQASATGSIQVAPAPSRRIDFQSSAALTAAEKVTLSAVTGSRIDAADGLAIKAGRDGAGGIVNVLTQPGFGGGVAGIGQIDVAGLLGIDVSGAATAGDASGGSAMFDAAGGAISADAIAIDASGRGGAGGKGAGGNVLIRVRNGGTIAASLSEARADGIGGDGGAIGGTGLGGTVTARSAGGELSLGSSTISVAATGGVGTVRDGDALGGSALLDMAAGSQTWDSLAIDASASTGLGAASTSGRITAMIAPAGEIVVGGDFAARATGQAAAAGAGLSLLGSNSAFRTGGAADVVVSGPVEVALGTAGLLDVAGALTVETPATIDAVSPVKAGSIGFIADGGIAATSVTSNGPTVLQAASGTITVVQDLRSAGPVTAQGETLQIVSGGSLDFARAEASSGDLAVQAAESLALDRVAAAGDAILHGGGGLEVGDVEANSLTAVAGGAFAATGMLDVSHALTIEAGGAASFGGAVSGETISIASADMALGGGARIGERGTTRSILLRKNAAAIPAAIGGDGSAQGFSLDAGEIAKLFADESIAIDLPFADQTASARVALGDFALSFGPAGNIGAGGTLQLTTTGDIDVTGAARLATQSDDDRFSLSARNITVDPAKGSIALQGGSGLQGSLEMAADTIIAATPAARATIASGAGPDAIKTALGSPAGTASDGGFFQAGRITAEVADGFFVQNSGAGAAFAARRGFSTNSLAITTAGPAAVIAINGRIFAGGSVLSGLDTVQGLTINGQPAPQALRVDPLSSVNGCALNSNCSAPPTIFRAPLSMLAGADIEGALRSAQAADVTAVPQSREPLSRQDGISLLERNDTLDGNELIASEARPNRASETLLPTANLPRMDWLLAKPLLPYLVYSAQPDPARQNPLIDEPATGVGNDDLWHGDCTPESQDPTCAVSGAATTPSRPGP